MNRPSTPFHFGLSRRVHNRPAETRRRRVRPNLERLEDRTAPALFNVNTLADLSIASGVNPDATIVGQNQTITLRSAIQAANQTPGGKTINLTLPGVYRIALRGTPGETDNAAGEFAILPAGGNLTIQNTSGGTALVDANHLGRVFDINPGNTNNPATKILVTFQGFTILNGVAFDAANPDGPNASGGGIRDQGNASLTLTNVVLTDNVASADGGGVSMENAPVSTAWTLTLNNTSVFSNHAGDAGGGVETDGTGKVFINQGSILNGNSCLNQGAAVWLDPIGTGSATLTMTGVLVASNTAQKGPTGAVGNAGNGAVTMINCSVENNFSGTTGGGFGDENNLGTLTVAGSYFFNNSAVGIGGAIQEGGPSTTITSTQIQRNGSAARGGGVFVSGPTLTLTESTLADNTAGVAGGGVEIETTGTGVNGSTITNCTIARNSALNNAPADGGGIDAPATFTGSLALVYDTISANFATSGGGIFWTGAAGSTFTVQNTILAGNFAGTAFSDVINTAGTFTDNGGNLVGIAGAGSGNTGFTASTTQTGTTAKPLDPLLRLLSNNPGPVVGVLGSQVPLLTEALMPFSPALNKAIALTTVPFDERDVTRQVKPDVGAFESIPLSGNAAFVEALFRDFLHRVGDPNNSNDAGAFINLLNAGAITTTQAAFAISHSAEALDILVDGLFAKLLNRAAGSGGEAAFVPFLQTGGSVEQVIALIVSSQEFAGLSGGSDSGFIQALYADLLGRSASNVEVANQLNMLPMLGRAGVASAILNSFEYRMDEIEQLYGFPLAPLGSVVSLYPNLLHRTAFPTPAEVSALVNLGMNLLALETFFAGGAEYFGLASTLTGGIF
jgi:hypothetical protein